MLAVARAASGTLSLPGGRVVGDGRGGGARQPARRGGGDADAAVVEPLRRPVDRRRAARDDRERGHDAGGAAAALRAGDGPSRWSSTSRSGWRRRGSGASGRGSRGREFQPGKEARLRARFPVASSRRWVRRARPRAEPREDARSTPASKLKRPALDHPEAVAGASGPPRSASDPLWACAPHDTGPPPAPSGPAGSTASGRKRTTPTSALAEPFRLVHHERPHPHVQATAPVTVSVRASPPTGRSRSWTCSSARRSGRGSRPGRGVRPPRA